MSLNETTEHCPNCERETRHEVEIQILTENPNKEHNAEFSREPYRISECDECGYERKKRMNDA